LVSQFSSILGQFGIIERHPNLDIFEIHILWIYEMI
jgi:hypothetical protein